MALFYIVYTKCILKSVFYIYYLHMFYDAYIDVGYIYIYIFSLVFHDEIRLLDFSGYFSCLLLKDPQRRFDRILFTLK